MVRRTRRFVTALVAAALLASTMDVAQFGVEQAHAKHLLFYLIPGISTDAFYTTMHKGAAAEAAAVGVTLKFQGNPTAFSPQTQIPILDAAIARHPDAILIAPTDKVALIAPIQRAVTAHIPIILVDTTINKPSLAVTSISSDNLKGGRTCAVALARALGKRGTVAAVSVAPGISTTDQRKQGFEQRIRTYKNIHYVGTQFDIPDTATRAAAITSALLTRYPTLSGIFAMNVVTGDGVTTAVRSAGKSKRIKLVEFDAEPIQVQALKQGTIAALVAQDPYTIGHLGVQLAYQYVTGHRSGIKSHYGTGEAIITAANVNNPSIKRFLYTK